MEWYYNASPSRRKYKKMNRFHVQNGWADQMPFPIPILMASIHILLDILEAVRTHFNMNLTLQNEYMVIF